MSIAISSALLGMRAATLRLQTSARNVANVNSQGTLPSTGSNSPQVYLLVAVDQVSLAGPGGTGGGTSASVRTPAPTWMAAYQPNAGFADSKGLVADPNIDLVAEALEQATARASFMANAKTLEVTQDMVKRLFELTDSD
jgi:flagellar basal-body rod protein FlgC